MVEAFIFLLAVAGTFFVGRFSCIPLSKVLLFFVAALVDTVAACFFRLQFLKLNLALQCLIFRLQFLFDKVSLSIGKPF